MRMVAYVSGSCGACARFLSMVAASPKLLAATDIRKVDNNPQAILEMHSLGALKTPTLVVLDQYNRPTAVYQGAQASQALISMA